MRWLEGPQEGVRAALSRIWGDDRHLEVLLQVEGEVYERMFPGGAMLHDPAATWIRSQEEIEDDAVKRATPEELIGFFLPLRDLNQPSGPVQRSGLR
jgi:hypothetical protein